MAETQIKTAVCLMNIHQTAAHAAFLSSIGWTIESQVLHGKTVYVFVRKLPLIPISFMKIQRIDPSLLDWDWFAALEKKHHVYETVIELDGLYEKEPSPEPKLLMRGFTPAPDFMLNTKTRIIDLSINEDTLLAEMKAKTRYNIHLAERYGLIVHRWSTKEVAETPALFEPVYRMLAENAKRIKMLLIPKEWIRLQFKAFGDTGWVLGLTHTETSPLLAVTAFYASTTTGSYNLNGSTSEGRRVMAPTLAVWEGIKEAKRRNLVDFDFDGVYDPRYGKRQSRFQGFGRFKAGFGGRELFFQPMYRKRRQPW